MDLKRSAKSLALDFSMHSPGSLSKNILRILNIGIDPLSSIRYQGKKALACVSVDFDHFSNVGRNSSRFEPGADMEKLALNKRGTKILLELSKRYDFPMTWAICGKTAEADVNSYHEIIDSGEGHEIGIHTYSHIDVSACSEEELELEILRCVEALNPPRSPKTFIFPWNRTSHFRKIKEMGFSTYRGKERVIGPPRENQGLLNVRPVIYCDKNSQNAFGVAKRLVDLCVARNSVFHLWTHPWSLFYLTEGEALSENFLNPIFAYLDEKRKSGEIYAATLGEVSSFLRMNRANLQIAPIGAS